MQPNVIAGQARQASSSAVETELNKEWQKNLFYMSITIYSLFERNQVKLIFLNKFSAFKVVKGSILIVNYNFE